MSMTIESGVRQPRTTLAPWRSARARITCTQRRMLYRGSMRPAWIMLRSVKTRWSGSPPSSAASLRSAGRAPPATGGGGVAGAARRGRGPRCGQAPRGCEQLGFQVLVLQLFGGVRRGAGAGRGCRGCRAPGLRGAGSGGRRAPAGARARPRARGGRSRPPAPSRRPARAGRRSVLKRSALAAVIAAPAEQRLVGLGGLGVHPLLLEQARGVGVIAGGRVLPGRRELVAVELQRLGGAQVVALVPEDLRRLDVVLRLHVDAGRAQRASRADVQLGGALQVAAGFPALGGAREVLDLLPALGGLELVAAGLVASRRGAEIAAPLLGRRLRERVGRRARAAALRLDEEAKALR